jgi:hypothetical protein
MIATPSSTLYSNGEVLRAVFKLVMDLLLKMKKIITGTLG